MSTSGFTRHEELGGLGVEDHGDQLYLIIEREGYDMTFAIDVELAERLALFILRRNRP